jgi:hypothetical protein
MANMEMKKTYSLAELEQERREIEEEFEGAEPIEIEIDPNLKVTILTPEESRLVEAGEDASVVLARRS